jgi:hypothetical protein
MSVKKTIELLKKCNLNETEQKLFDVNMQLLNTKFICCKKIAISGLKEMLFTHSFVLGLQNMVGKDIFKVGNTIVVKRW